MCEVLEFWTPLYDYVGMTSMPDYEKLGLFYLGRDYDLAAGERLSEKLLYDSRDLTTHAVCVGMTGSGKTGLCLSLIEEAGLDNVPVIAIAGLAFALPFAFAFLTGRLGFDLHGFGAFFLTQSAWTIAVGLGLALRKPNGGNLDSRV